MKLTGGLLVLVPLLAVRLVFIGGAGARNKGALFNSKSVIKAQNGVSGVVGRFAQEDIIRVRDMHKLHLLEP